ncbi:MAG: hypothetical protein J0J01_18610 [Reyranella sp.]|uniref:ArnT family glycosyltransferase n=1 Tax=Reyranella sp. TaxID=1929291 RepID=UPI001AC526D7|nr:hypothetical protein [Reyranella sp.]MBN9088923.1 hypothetical protein [Reyranella sp.]
MTSPSAVEGRAHLAPASSRTWLLASAVAGASWFVVDGLLLPPAFGGTDIYYFKDAGINLVSGLGFVSRFTFGNPTFLDQVYAQYPPIYPLLFGLFAKLFGISAVTNQAFNAAVGVALGLAGFLAVRPLIAREFPRLGPVLLASLLTISVVASLFLPGVDRPDGLGICLGLAGLVVFRRQALGPGAVAAGILCGVALLVSPFAGGLGLIVVGIVVLDRYWREKGLVAAIAGGLRTVAGALGVLVVGASLMVLFFPAWLPAFAGVFLGTTTQNETGGGYFLALLRGEFGVWLGAFPVGDPYYFVALSKFVFVLVVLVAAAIVDCLRSGRSALASAIVPLIVISPLCLIVMPYQGNYPPMSAALVLGAIAGVALGIPPTSRRIHAVAVLIGFAGVCLLSLPERVRDTNVRIATRGSMRPAVEAIDQLRDRLRGSDAFLAVSPANYILWRQEGLRPLITTYSGLGHPEHRQRLLYVVASYGGSGDRMAPQLPSWLTDKEYRLVHQPSLPQQVSILGLFTTNSSWTWESAIYRRKD